MNILLITNVSRSYCLYKKNIDRLAQAAPELQCRAWLTDSSEEWSQEWAARITAADIILFLWMGTGLDAPCCQKASRFMQRRQLRHLILVDNPGKDKIPIGFTPEQI